MKSKVAAVLLLFMIAVMFNACKKNTTEPAAGVVSGNFFPNGDGTFYKYSVQSTDSAGNVHQGTRTTTYSGTSSYGGAVFQRQVDSLSIMGVNSSFVTLFQKSDSEVDYVVDTTGLSNIIPDSLMRYIQIDGSFKLLKFPFEDGLTWPVFNLKINLVKMNLISVTASYEGMKSVTLNLDSGPVNKNAAEIQYKLVLTIPDPNNILNPNPPSETFTANAWVVDNIGIVKWEGNGAIIGAFTGSSINIADTTSSVTQNLVSYGIK